MGVPGPGPSLRSFVCAVAPGPGLAPAGPSPAAVAPVVVVALAFRQNNKSKSPSRTPMNFPTAMTNKRAFKAAMQMTMIIAMGRNNHHLEVGMKAMPSGKPVKRTFHTIFAM